jgi:hypothetical protein
MASACRRPDTSPDDIQLDDILEHDVLGSGYPPSAASTLRPTLPPGLHSGDHHGNRAAFWHQLSRGGGRSAIFRRSHRNPPEDNFARMGGAVDDRQRGRFLFCASMKCDPRSRQTVSSSAYNPYRRKSDSAVQGSAFTMLPSKPRQAEYIMMEAGGRSIGHTSPTLTVTGHEHSVSPLRGVLRNCHSPPSHRSMSPEAGQHARDSYEWDEVLVSQPLRGVLRNSLSPPSRRPWSPEAFQHPTAARDCYASDEGLVSHWQPSRRGSLVVAWADETAPARACSEPKVGPPKADPKCAAAKSNSTKCDDIDSDDDDGPGGRSLARAEGMEARVAHERRSAPPVNAAMYPSTTTTTTPQALLSAGQPVGAGNGAFMAQERSSQLGPSGTRTQYVLVRNAAPPGPEITTAEDSEGVFGSGLSRLSAGSRIRSPIPLNFEGALEEQPHQQLPVRAHPETEVYGEATEEWSGDAGLRQATVYTAERDRIGESLAQDAAGPQALTDFVLSLRQEHSDLSLVAIAAGSCPSRHSEANHHEPELARRQGQFGAGPRQDPQSCSQPHPPQSGVSGSSLPGSPAIHDSYFSVSDPGRMQNGGDERIGSLENGDACFHQAACLEVDSDLCGRVTGKETSADMHVQAIVQSADFCEDSGEQCGGEDDPFGLSGMEAALLPCL